MDDGAIYLSLYNEIFVNAKPSFFDRNRIYGALGYVDRKNLLRIEVGYMDQRVEYAPPVYNLQPPTVASRNI